MSIAWRRSRGPRRRSGEGRCGRVDERDGADAAACRPASAVPERVGADADRADDAEAGQDGAASLVVACPSRSRASGSRGRLRPFAGDLAGGPPNLRQSASAVSTGHAPVSVPRTVYGNGYPAGRVSESR